MSGWRGRKGGERREGTNSDIIVYTSNLPTHTQRVDGVIEYQGFVRVHMCVQRPIHVSTAITRTSWYRLMRPVKERGKDMHDGFEVNAVHTDSPTSSLLLKISLLPIPPPSFVFGGIL